MKNVIIGAILTVVLGATSWVSATVIEHGNLIAAHGAVQQLVLEQLKRMEDKIDALFQRERD